MAIAFAALASLPASAHIKWFEPYDLTKPMLPASDVLTKPFICCFLASVILIYGFFWVDRYVFRHGILEEALKRYTVSIATSFQIMRWSAFAFFTAVSCYGFSGHAFYLTPELKTDALWVPYLQALIALSALHPRSTPFIGGGALVLYFKAIGDYGMYHLLDYLIVPGLSYYFIASPKAGQGWIMSRYIVLYAATGLTMLWGAVEKWAYPLWTYPLLERNPGLLMGLPENLYMIFAGFVEFNLTFVVLGSASLLSRAMALAFFSIFALAILKFGMIDAVGHLMFMAIMVVLVVRGPTKGRDFLVLASKSLWTEAYFMTGLYCLAFDVMILAYYGLHYLAFGN